MESGIPGRSWPAAEVPTRLTDLDERIIDLAGGRIPKKRLRSPEILAEGGITSVLYAARVFTLIAWNNANVDSRALSKDRVQKLENERDAFKRRVGSTRVILEEDSDPSRAARAGNPYLDPIDPQEVAAERESGRALYAALATELERDTARIAMVQRELDRLATFEGLKVWDASFFRLMGILWGLFTEQLPAVNRGGPFTQLLDAAVATLSEKAEPQGRPWGVAKNMLERSEKHGPGVGFRLYEAGALSLDSIHQLESRGPDMRTFIGVAAGDGDAMTGAIVALRDHSERPDEVLMRELVLRPPFRSRGLLPAIVRAQLGWLYEVDAKQIRSAARSAIDAAHKGDARATAVVELAGKAQSLATGRQGEWGERYGISWPKSFCGRSPADVRRELHERAVRGDLLSCALMDWPGLWRSASRLPGEPGIAFT
ncbi:hypothetical protein MKL09_25305 [Methylobacterium sp. J-048]|uniref:hypothetical protein n=1 Tax=Methylobacterium sp. J-048 TaxID=2836635 RepID=UPI001FB971AD|nr:hypothetical protein [Methylobacterium sp. J-048]MCJ2059835.1 hypothetical protein [Methylobacterium sp. J-048]